MKLEPIEEVSEYDGEGTLEHPYPCDKIEGAYSRNTPPKYESTLNRRKARQMMESGGQEKGFVKNDRPVPKRLKF